MMRTVTRARRAVGALAAALLLAFAGPLAAPPPALAQAEAADEDPLEDLNRAFYEFNRVLDGLLVKPAAMIYRGVVPEEGRDAVRNVLDNLNGPVILANDLMQGEWDRAGVTLERFAINTTFGVLGIFDAAKDHGLVKHDEDFGQTLAVWGVGGDPYLFLPILGPSNPRDFTGLLVDSFIIDPWGWIIRGDDYFESWFNWTRVGLEIVDRRARNIEALDDIERNQLDPYAFIRTAWRQRRANDILNGRPSARRAPVRPETAGAPPAPTWRGN
ncbi:MAG: VacJ family lipoprotein [Alphaproteobacteria bacterium]